MEQALPWHEDDEFWESTGSWLFTDQAWQLSIEEVDQLISLLDLKPPADILDLCCGPGRHALELDRRGFIVTAVDRTENYLKEARRRAEDEGLAVEFIQDDMRNFCRQNSFDVVINMFTAFGYFENDSEEQQVLDNVFQSLRSGGKFVLQLKGREVLARIFLPRDWRHRNGVIVLEERIPSEDWSFLENRLIIINGLERKEFKFKVRNYSASELKVLLLKTGFKNIGIYGDLDGSPYDHTAKWLVMVGEK